MSYLRNNGYDKRKETILIDVSLLEAVKEIGLLSVLTLGILFLCIWLVKYMVLRLTKEIDKTTVSLDKICNIIDRHDTLTSDAHKYQRDEHKEMIATLQLLNGKIK